MFYGGRWSAQGLHFPRQTPISGRSLGDRARYRGCRGAAPGQLAGGRNRFLMSLKGPSEHSLLFLRRGRRIRDRRLGGWTHRTLCATDRNEILAQDFHEVGRKQSHHPPIASQSAHPPLTIARVQTFYQIALHKPQISLGFSAPGVHGSTPAGEPGGQLRCARGHHGEGCATTACRQQLDLENSLPRAGVNQLADTSPSRGRGSKVGM